jgi:hypothetical protein
VECQCILAGVLIEHAEILSCLPEDKLLSVQTEIEKLQNEKYQGGDRHPDLEPVSDDDEPQLRFRSITPPLVLARSRTPSMTPPLWHSGTDSRSRTMSLTQRLTPVSLTPRLTPPLHHNEDAGMEVPRAGYEAQACASAGRGIAGSRNNGVDGDESAHAVQKFVASEVSKLFMQERGSLLEQLQAPTFRKWLHENESFISEHGGPLRIGSKWERVHSVLKTDIEFVNSKLASALLNKRHGTFNRKELDSFGVRTVLVRPLCLFVCVTSASFPYRFPDDRTPIEDTPLSATSTELGLIWGLGLGLDSLSHSSSPPFSFFSPPSFHTLSLSPEFTSVWWSA